MRKLEAVRREVKLRPGHVTYQNSGARVSIANPTISAACLSLNHRLDTSLKAKVKTYARQLIIVINKSTDIIAPLPSRASILLPLNIHLERPAKPLSRPSPPPPKYCPAEGSGN